jgi:uncharacterized protein involved in exopolysaccharide biosynthesis
MTIARDAAREISLRDVLRIFQKHRFLIVGVFLVTVATVAIWTFTQTPIYQATATVMIDPEAPKFLNIQDVSPLGAATQDYYLTQYEIIKSRPVVDRAMESVKLKEAMPSLAAARDPHPMFRGWLVVEPKRNTRLVFIKFEHRDPKVAADVANAVAAAYARYNVEIKLKGAREALGWLTEEMNQLRTRVQESSVALQNYRVKSGILGLEEQRKITSQKIIDFNRAYLEAQAQRLSIEAKLGELTKIARDKPGAQSIFTVADNPLIQKLKAEASDLDVQRSKLLKVYKEKHPEVLKVDAQIQQVNQRIDTEMKTMLRGVQTEFRVAKAREETLLGNVNQLRREGQDLNEKEIQYQNLMRESDSNQQLYESVLKRLKETSIAGGLETNNVKIIEPAVAPRSPIRPRRDLNLLLSVVVGLVVGVGLATVIEYFDTSVKSPDDVERYLGLPVLGIVPLFSQKRS